MCRAWCDVVDGPSHAAWANASVDLLRPSGQPISWQCGAEWQAAIRCCPYRPFIKLTKLTILCMAHRANVAGRLRVAPAVTLSKARHSKSSGFSRPRGLLTYRGSALLCSAAKGCICWIMDWLTSMHPSGSQPQLLQPAESAARVGLFSRLWQKMIGCFWNAS